MATEIVAHVDISEQEMVVVVNGEAKHRWPVSTARPGEVTPTGEYTPQWLSRHHRSSLYNNAPMPFAVFYDGNYAVHGTTQVAQLGTPASAGCVRLAPENAKVFFEMVRSAGLASARIVVVE